MDERIDQLDAVRGFALIGICIANLVSFAGFYVMTHSQRENLPWASMDPGVLFFIDWLVEGKFYSIFSLLFGMGFWLQATRADKSISSFKVFWLRRMGALLLFGVAHMFLIWPGDILMLYSAMGIILLLFIKASSRKLLLWVVLLLSLPWLIQWVAFFTSDHIFWKSLAQLSERLKEQWGFGGRSLFDMQTSNSVFDHILSNFFRAVERPMSYLKSGRPMQVLGQFLLGMWIAREILFNMEGKQTLFYAWGKWMGGVGLFTGLVYASIKGFTGSPWSPDETGILQSLAYHISCTSLALWYIRLIWQNWLYKRWRKIFRWLVPLGRMPLTTYLTQSIIGLCLFYDFGLGWRGFMPFSGLIPITLLIIILQQNFSRWWLSRRTRGPLESLWRLLAYGDLRVKQP